MSKQVKYLGVLLDAKLNWNLHLDAVISKATRAFWACRQAIGKTWGLSPKITFWLYKTAITPIVTYAALVWWTKTNKVGAQTKLERLQRLACLCVTGGMATTPTAAMEALIGFPPLHILVRREALTMAMRLHYRNMTKPGDWTGHLNILQQADPKFLQRPTDQMLEKHTFDRFYKVINNSPDKAAEEVQSIPAHASVWYTDGSAVADIREIDENGVFNTFAFTHRSILGYGHRLKCSCGYTRNRRKRRF